MSYDEKLAIAQCPCINNGATPEGKWRDPLKENNVNNLNPRVVITTCSVIFKSHFYLFCVLVDPVRVCTQSAVRVLYRIVFLFSLSVPLMYVFKEWILLFLIW